MASERAPGSGAPAWVPALLSIAVAVALTAVGAWFLVGGGVWWLLVVGPFAAIPAVMDGVRGRPNPDAYRAAFWTGVASCVVCAASLFTFGIFVLYLVPATIAMRIAWRVSAAASSELGDVLPRG